MEINEYIKQYKEKGGYIKALREHIGHAPIITIGVGVMIENIRQELPLMAECPEDNASQILTNVQLYRLYIERYLRHHPDVNQDLDIIVTQKEATAYGLPIEVYFFTRDKAWAVYERKQSDIFDHLMTVAQDFSLRIYQRP